MPTYLTLASLVQCAHQGIVQFPPDPQCSLLVNGSEVLRKNTLLASPIVGCTWVGTGRVPCTKIASLDFGEADEIDVSGDVPVLENLRFTTNGNGPPGCSVVNNASSNAETVPESSHTPPPPSKDWSVSNLSWNKTEARDGQKVFLNASVQGLPTGTPVRATIYEHDADGAHDYVARITDASVVGGRIQIPWTFQYVGDVDDIPTDDEARQEGKRYTIPEYFFVLRVAGRTFGDKAESGLLTFQDFLEFHVVDDATGDAISNLEVEITLPDGRKEKKRLDRNGKCRLDSVPPGRCSVVLKEA